MMELFDGPKPVIGVLHLPPLPGSPGAEAGGGRAADGGTAQDRIRDRALRDARALAEGAVDGLLVENFGDAPFFPNRVPSHTVAHMAVLAETVRRETGLPLGVNVLRNDGEAAMAVAAAAGAAFIRVNVYTGARLTDQGVIQGRAHRILRLRRALGAEVQVFADVGVKHSSPLGPGPLAREAREAVDRAGADAVIVTGTVTGRPVEPERLDEVVRAVPETPVLAGSGVTADSLRETLSRCAGAIVGTAFKEGSVVTEPVDRDRVAALTKVAREARGRDA